jgi:hypothetical protein
MKFKSIIIFELLRINASKKLSFYILNYLISFPTGGERRGAATWSTF